MIELKNIGFIGVGAMGGRMCRNLALKSGKHMIAYDINYQAVMKLVDFGVEAAPSIASLTKKSNLIIMCLPGEPHVRDVCLGDDGVLTNAQAGQIIVDMSTATPTIARQLSKKFAEKSVAFADAPVSRGVSAAEDGTLSIMFGGTAELLERIRPALECMGTSITHCGGVGTGQVMKLMNNMVIFQNVSALAEALTIAKRFGVDGELLFETLSRGSADSYVLQKHGIKYMVKGIYPDDLFPITYSLKDLRYILQLAEETNVDAAGARVVERRFEEAIEAGYGKLYSPVIQKLMERRAQESDRSS
jgi:3-hydroxyisobutyrate dehydrogenase-like beta-hydroxyacid dehydrogenase